MEDIRLDSPELIDAIQRWSGRSISSFPRRDESCVRNLPEGEKLLSIVKQLEADFYKEDTTWNNPSLQDAGALAKARFRQLYPNAAMEIADILEWCYTYDFK